MRFWIRVYTEVTTDQGLLHDDWNLGLVYEVLRFDPATLALAARTPRGGRPRRAMRRCCGAFAGAASTAPNLTAHERRILHAFGEEATAGANSSMRSAGYASNWGRRIDSTRA